MLPELGQMPPGQRRGRRSERLTARECFSFSVSTQNGCCRPRAAGPLQGSHLFVPTFEVNRTRTAVYRSTSRSPLQYG